MLDEKLVVNDFAKSVLLMVSLLMLDLDYS
jgi:hypothetical protein